MSFISTGVDHVEGANFHVKGDLTIHGVTKPVILEAEFLGRAKDPWGGERAGFSAKTSINRKDFGLGWNVALEAGGVLVGEKVEITIEAEAVKAK
jgi:polyisoprenoid-binding protein YceI